MAETRKIRYTGKVGPQAVNMDGAWDAGTEREVPAGRAETYVNDGLFEYADAEPKKKKAKKARK
jgi:hypothetical protein